MIPSRVSAAELSHPGSRFRDQRSGTDYAHLFAGLEVLRVVGHEDRGFRGECSRERQGSALPDLDCRGFRHSEIQYVMNATSDGCADLEPEMPEGWGA